MGNLLLHSVYPQMDTPASDNQTVIHNIRCYGLQRSNAAVDIQRHWKGWWTREQFDRWATHMHFGHLPTISFPNFLKLSSVLRCPDYRGMLWPGAIPPPEWRRRMLE